jgi:cell division protein FtsL
MSRVADSLSRVFAQRVRGFRAVNVGACAIAVLLALGVYAFKADAAKENNKIREVNRAIAAETRAVRLLRAEVAHLEQPARLERLATLYLGLQPQDARREAPVDGLTELAHHSDPGRRVGPPISATPAAPPAVALTPASAEPVQ